MKLTVAVLLAAACLGAQTGKDLPGRKGDIKMPGEPGVMHPLPVPKTSPEPVPVEEDKAKSRSANKSSSSKQKSSGPSSGSSSKQGTTKKVTESPKAKTETQP